NSLSRNDTKTKGKHSPVVIARIAFSVLGCLMLGTLIYTLLTDGSPFRKELPTPWMTATLIDFYINVVALSVSLGRLQRIKLDYNNSLDSPLICFGSITTCAYIVKELFKLAWQDPLYLVLIKEDDRAENTYESIK
ncbi:uncharacterized protein LOC120134530, partial [Hibiscus syriacus]|uniref:uncharacterized protein LOC120134530 n=1 Tax=Hibiscus syriacus TaxID=106335 RepID=UPI001921E863